MNTVLRDRRGFALEATIVVLVLLTVLIGAAVTSAVMTQRTAGVDYRGSRVSYATEAGADAVMSQLEVAMVDGIVTAGRAGRADAPGGARLHLHRDHRRGRRRGPPHHHERALRRPDRPQSADRHHRRGAGPAAKPGPGHRHGQRPVDSAVPVRCVLRGRPRDSQRPAARLRRLDPHQRQPLPDAGRRTDQLSQLDHDA